MAYTNRERIIELQKIFEECSRNEAGITMSTIQQRLSTEGDKQYDRKVIYQDIQILNDLLNLKITYDQKNRLYRSNFVQKLTDGELEIIVNALLIAHFISIKDTSEIIKHIYHLNGSDFSKALGKTVHLEDRVKNSNEQVHIIKNIKSIREAIKSNKKISFDYYKYNREKEFELQKNDCVVSPYEMVWFQDYYYLLGHYTGDKISHYRLDRIVNLKTLAENRKSITIIMRNQRGFKIADYMSRLVGMSSGDTQNVMIRFSNEFIGEIIDTLGNEVSIINEEGNTFILNADMLINKKLVRWILSFGNGAQVIFPNSLIEEVNQMK